MNPPTVTLSNGDQLQAEYLTTTAYLPLASVVLDETETFPDLAKPGMKEVLARRIFNNLKDPAFVKGLAFGLITIFPKISDRLVWFDAADRRPSYGVAGLEIEDILRIITTIAGVMPSKPARVPVAISNGHAPVAIKPHRR